MFNAWIRRVRRDDHFVSWRCVQRASTFDASSAIGRKAFSRSGPWGLDEHTRRKKGTPPMRKLILALFVAAATAAIIAPLALAGGNSDNAQACQQNGWQNLLRQDGTGFKNTGDCVSYAAHGGVLNPRAAAVVPGSEDFSTYDASSKPTTFSWGTIDSGDYAPGDSTPNGGIGGSILVSGPYFNAFSTGITHFLFTGWYVNSAKVTFNSPVQDLQV